MVVGGALLKVPEWFLLLELLLEPLLRLVACFHFGFFLQVLV
jgi:hypothetical protein